MPEPDEPMSDRVDDEKSIEAALEALSKADDPAKAAEELLERLGVEAAEGDEAPPATWTPYEGIHSDAPREERRSFSFLGLLLAVLTAAGIAASIALLYQGMADIMETSGGFVATGGPYVIAQPAPDWVALMPLSVMGIIFFGIANIWAASRGWGISLVIYAWMALFISLGWNFLRLGFNPPKGLQGAWAWILCGVIFWIMGFWPLLLLLAPGRSWFEALVSRQSGDARKAWRVPKRSDTTGAYLAAQVVGAVAGVVGAVVLFGFITG